MRKRKYLIGAASALVLSIAVAGTSHSAGFLFGQTVTETVSAPKLDKKTPGAITSSKTLVETQYTGLTPPFDAKAVNTKVDFPKDWSFTPGTLPQCNPASIATATTADAKTACAGSQVGSGAAVLNGAVPNVPATVTAFNGTQPEGLPVVLLHSRTGPPLNSTSVLVGTLRPGPGGAYGKTLDVIVPILAGGAFVITSFDTTIPKLQTVKKNKKKNKPAKYYIMAKCSKKSWSFQARSTYNNGVTTTDTSTATCKQKKPKKKK
jgi:hypothetical protein